MNTFLTKVINSAIGQWISGYVRGGFSLDLVTTLASGALLYFGWYWLNNIGMGDIATASLLSKLLNIVVVVIVLRLLLRGLDKLIGFQFKVWFADADQYCKAAYVCTRFLGLCILFGMILG